MSEQEIQDLTTEEQYLCYRQAGKIAYEVHEELKDMIKAGTKIIDICNRGYELIQEKGAKSSFPVNVSINNVAAHYTSPYKDESVIPEGAVVKLDLGVHVYGFISDVARTYDLSNEWSELVNAAQEAYKAGLELMRIGEETIVLGRAIEEAIKSSDFLPIRELSGHQVERYLLHSKKSIPNIAVPFGRAGSIMEANEVYALECFASNGIGSVKENVNRKYIYSFIPKRVAVRSRETKKIFSFIAREYQTLPFASRWLMENEEFNPARVRFALNELQKVGALHGHGVLSDEKDSFTSQYENTIYLHEERGPIVTTLPPFDFEFTEELEEKLKKQEEYMQTSTKEA
jgi:methionyl aminopeptidase